MLKFSSIVCFLILSPGQDTLIEQSTLYNGQYDKLLKSPSNSTSVFWRVHSPDTLVSTLTYITKSVQLAVMDTRLEKWLSVSFVSLEAGGTAGDHAI